MITKCKHQQGFGTINVYDIIPIRTATISFGNFCKIFHVERNDVRNSTRKSFLKSKTILVPLSGDFNTSFVQDNQKFHTFLLLWHSLVPISVLLPYHGLILMLQSHSHSTVSLPFHSLTPMLWSHFHVTISFLCYSC